MLSREEIALLYGKSAIVSRKGRFALIHLDRPSRALVRARTREFNPNRFFDAKCSVCQTAKAAGVVIFDDQAYDCDEEILLE